MSDFVSMLGRVDTNGTIPGFISDIFVWVRFTILTSTKKERGGGVLCVTQLRVSLIKATNWTIQGFFSRSNFSSFLLGFLHRFRLCHHQLCVRPYYMYITFGRFAIGYGHLAIVSVVMASFSSVMMATFIFVIASFSSLLTLFSGVMTQRQTFQAFA